ncbi:MAG TPA: DUF1015 family protein [Methylomirabilota bacterium]|jgi:uncharacterized protein (DUF1015 family)|nr:DUF1015 family protein [Methylomirabilota bacterium]
MRLHPFAAMRPVPELAPAVVSPPYDVVTREQAARLGRDNPLSFLHVVRSDIDLAPDLDPHDPRVYDRARQSLDRLVADGVLVRDEDPSLYLYRMVAEGRSQVGVVGGVHVGDYAGGVIRRHESTRPDKEDDRTRHILALDAHAEPVLLAYPEQRELEQLAGTAMGRLPLYDFATDDQVRHTVWRVPHPRPYVEAFADVPCAYIADGHHRSASAWRAARERGAVNARHSGDEEYNWFLAVLVPARQLRILPYNRLITGLGGQEPGRLLSRLASLGRLTPASSPTPPRPGSFCLYLGRRWHRLELDESSIDRADPRRALDVALLQERVLGPLLGIDDQRTDKRIDFVGGKESIAELEARVDAGAAALAISMFPTSMAELIAVSDAGQMMPPKSTWFEPKLLSGLFVHPIV